MKSDIARWNQKYAKRTPDFQPDTLLTDFQDLLTGGGAAIDIACGVGQNALFLARRGYQAFAVDCSVVGVRYCMEAAQQEGLAVFPFVADLDRYRLPKNQFDIIVVFRFLNRELITNIKHALKHDGLVFYQTFNRNFLAEHPEFNPAYIVRPGELSEMFADLVCCATNDADCTTESQTYWIGRKN
ncbi:MAG: class I SAM-dependent methyltransferase [Gammaproteobacteria bacterium]|nr:class I SAM-dependent methyltransferase [Gammaproteobacteria bacterium]